MKERRTKSRVSLKVVDPNKSWLVGDSFQLVPAAKEITTHVCEKIRETKMKELEEEREIQRDSTFLSSGPKASFRYLVVSVDFCTVQTPRYACSPCGYLTLVYPFKLERRSQFHLHERERTQLSSSKVGKSCGFLLEDENGNLFDTRK